jgi:polysaccharide pyruvyl transferase WcaK-like protein
MAPDPTGRIGIFGFYSYQNFGDNLMAVMICRHLQSLGARPVVFSRDPQFAQTHGVPVEADLDALVAQSDLMVLGGGGQLIPRPRMRGNFAQFSADMRRLVDLCQEHAVALYGISIECGAKALDQIVPAERRDLLHALAYSTLRNPHDAGLFQQAGIPCDVVPDLVWTTPRFFPKPARKGNRKTVGLNLYLHKTRRSTLLKWLLRLITILRPDLDFVFIDVTPKPGGGFRALDLSAGQANCSRAMLMDLARAMDVICECDLIISTRLHLEVVAMSHGVPSVAYDPQPKTRQLYEHIGLANMVWRGRELHKFIGALLWPGGLDRLRARHDPCRVEAMMADAARHYEALADIVRRHRPD